jgi:hypothetical protein
MGICPSSTSRNGSHVRCHRGIGPPMKDRLESAHLEQHLCSFSGVCTFGERRREGRPSSGLEIWICTRSYQDLANRSRRNPLIARVGKSGFRVLPWALKTGNLVWCQGICFLTHHQGERPFTVWCGSHGNRLQALNAIWYLRLGPGTQGHEWENMKSK